MLHFILSITYSFLLFFGSKPTTPPGTVHLTKKVFIDQNELSNLAWIEYIHWLKNEFGEASTEVKQALPDSASYWTLYTSNFTPTTFKNGYLHFPIVGISYQQAVNYCQWRSNRVNELNSTKEKVTYRLPTLKEFELAKELDEPCDKKYYNPQLNLFASVQKGGRKHIFQLMGNVAEMTSEEGVAFGGKPLNTTTNYDNVGSMLGFRCVAEFE